MKTILLMRHSHATSNNPAYSDHQRPLSNKGRELAQVTADLLTELRPDRILCSSAARTQQTADVFAANIANGLRPESFESLYLAPAEAYLKLAQIFINEARITGEHGHYYPAALEVVKTGLAQPLANPDLRFRLLSSRASVEL